MRLDSAGSGIRMAEHSSMPAQGLGPAVSCWGWAAMAGDDSLLLSWAVGSHRDVQGNQRQGECSGQWA